MITIVNNVLTTYSYLQSDVSLGRGDRAAAEEEQESFP